MKTQKIVRFTRNFDRRHRTDVYLYANTYEDITSLIENEINDNVYGISDYPISNTVESELYESLNMAFWEEQYEDDYERLLTYLVEEKLLSDSSQFLAILEDSYKAGKLSLDQAPAQGYLCLVTDKQAKNGIGYLTTMTQQDLESYLAPYKAIILKEGIDREVKERIRS